MSVVESVWENEDVTHDDMIDQVLKALDVLPPRSREVLECVHLKNMKYVEVAELLGISVATVKTLLVRSLKTLRGIVSDMLCCWCLFIGKMVVSVQIWECSLKS